MLLKAYAKALPLSSRGYLHDRIFIYLLVAKEIFYLKFFFTDSISATEDIREPDKETLQYWPTFIESDLFTPPHF